MFNLHATALGDLLNFGQPRFFTGAVTPVGKPDLTPDGLKALDGLHKGVFELEDPKEYAAF